MFPSEYRTSSNFHSHSPQQIPRSAPHGGLFGSHIYSINESESSRKLKQHQKQLYFQELTRQVQEKQERRQSAANITSSEPQRSTITSNFSPMDVGSLPKYQKKYQIENHSTFYGNQVLGGALQRDETLLLKHKKEQQQREMQEYLRFQVEEKQKMKEIHRQIQMERDVAEENKLKQQQEDEAPVKTITPQTLSPPLLQPSVASEEDNENENEKEKEKLEALCQQLMEEQEKLKGMIKKQEEVIEDLKDTKPPVPSTTSKRRRTANNRTTLRIKDEVENARHKHEAENSRTKHETENSWTKLEIEKNRTKHETENSRTKHETENSRAKHEIENSRTKHEIENSRAKHETENSRAKHEAERTRTKQEAERTRSKHDAERTRTKHEAEIAKLSAIDQKIENARRRRIENAQKKKEGFLRNNPDNKRNSEVIARTKSAQINNQWNLDTSAKSTFIYPNSNGMYVQETPKETIPDFSATSSFAFSYADRREGRPMIAKGFPAGVFRLP